MNVLVTSGGTREYIDDVRVLTNISSGKLGAKIAFFLCQHLKVPVHYLHSRGSVVPVSAAIYMDKLLHFHEANSTQDVFDKMKELVPKMDVVIHAMAVSDFGFKRDGAVKLKSNDPEAFIEYMRQNITINPKILSFVKGWNPNVFLVSFKFEVGKTLDELHAIALESLRKNGSDLVVANDKEMMVASKRHTAYFITPDGKRSEEVVGKTAIAAELVKTVKGL